MYFLYQKRDTELVVGGSGKRRLLAP